jgi:hypothetical protein
MHSIGSAAQIANTDVPPEPRRLEMLVGKLPVWVQGEMARWANASHSGPPSLLTKSAALAGLAHLIEDGKLVLSVPEGLFA